jgi:hypothetical protein
MRSYCGYRPEERQERPVIPGDTKKLSLLFRLVERLGVASTAHFLNTGKKPRTCKEAYLLQSADGDEVEVSREEFLLTLRRIFRTSH